MALDHRNCRRQAELCHFSTVLAYFKFYDASEGRMMF